jgi:hypothetical protein
MDKSLADAIRHRVDQLNDRHSGRRRVMPWGDSQSVEAAMLEIADVLDEWSKEGKYSEQAD